MLLRTSILIAFLAVSLFGQNRVIIGRAADGSSPDVRAVGSDTNIAIKIVGKGTGAVKLGQSTSAGVDLVADQPIRDSNDNELVKFGATGSAVNEVTVTNAITATNPKISATGGDTNIDLELAGKGTGVVLTDRGAAQAGVRQVKLFQMETNAEQVDQVFWISDGAYVVEAIYEIHKALASSGPTTIALKKAADGVAIASGTAIMSDTFDMTGTNATLQTATVAAGTVLAENDRVGVDYTGTITSITGVNIALVLSPGGKTESIAFYANGNGDLADDAFFVANRPMIVTGAKFASAVVGSDGSDVNVQLVKDTSTDAPGAGTNLLTNNSSNGFDLKGTVNTVQEGTLTGTAASLRLLPGDRLSVDFAGTLTAAVGVVVMVELQPIPDRIEVSFSSLKTTTAVLDQQFFIADRAYQIMSVSEVHATAGNDGGSVVVQVTVDTGTDAAGAGTDVITSTGFNLKGTANTVQVGAFTSTAVPYILTGERLSVDFAGTLATLDGVVVSVSLKPL